LRFFPALNRTTPPCIRETISVLGEDAILEWLDRMFHIHLSQRSTFKFKEDASQPVGIMEKKSIHFKETKVPINIRVSAHKNLTRKKMSLGKSQKLVQPLFAKNSSLVLLQLF
jgi:hypothetical protein